MRGRGTGSRPASGLRYDAAFHTCGLHRSRHATRSLLAPPCYGVPLKVRERPTIRGSDPHLRPSSIAAYHPLGGLRLIAQPPSRRNTEGLQAACDLRRHSTLAAYLNRDTPPPWRSTTDCPTLPQHTTQGSRAAYELRRRSTLAAYLNRGMPLSWRLTAVGVTQKCPSSLVARAHSPGADGECAGREAGAEEAALRSRDQGRAADALRGQVKLAPPRLVGPLGHDKYRRSVVTVGDVQDLFCARGSWAGQMAPSRAGLASGRPHLPRAPSQTTR